MDVEEEAKWEHIEAAIPMPNYFIEKVDVAKQLLR